MCRSIPSLNYYACTFIQVKMSWYEPNPRIHPYVASVGKKCYMYGGSCSPDEPASFVEVFDQQMKIWTKLQAISPPSDKRRTRGACCSVSSGDIYFYGGFLGNELCDHFYKLTTTTRRFREWTKLSPGGDNKPLKKAGCEMVAFHKTRIALYGGQTFRYLLSSQQLTRTVSVGGDWRITNELHVFDTLTGKSYTVSRNYYCLCVIQASI